MRRCVLGLSLVIASVLAVIFVADREVILPRIGPRVEDVCVQAMKRSPPDQTWVAEGYQERGAQDVQLGELVSHHGDLVRVAGVLHAEFEWVALYPSRAAMEDAHWGSPWVDLESLWPGRPFWQRRLSISDRCVLVEGTYSSGTAGHFGGFNGNIGARRLDVWSMPHRPFVMLPAYSLLPPPPPR